MTQERLYTPWRMKYILSDKEKDGCVFCNGLNATVADDRKNFIVHRAEKTFTILNIYPYNVGHLMVLPRRHISTLAELPRSTQFEMMLLVTYFSELLAELMKPEGFNIGVNMGKAAGAGIDAHLHMHIVPRWSGDSNFMPVLGQTRILPEDLGETYEKIVAKMKEMPPPSL